MNIAVDFHGCLDTYPEVFKPMLESLYESHYIHILSGPPLKQIHEELREHDYMCGVHFNSVVSVVDWIKSKGVIMHQHANGSWYCDDDFWWTVKARICEERGIDVMYDDKLQYKEHIKNNKPLFFHVPTKEIYE